MSGYWDLICLAALFLLLMAAAANDGTGGAPDRERATIYRKLNDDADAEYKRLHNPNEGP